MSGAGKSHWSKKMTEKGFVYHGCDDFIEAKLDIELKSLGYEGIAGVSKWMGQPYEERFEKTSQTYLGFETESIQTILDRIENGEFENQNLVIDTTGSLIYLDQELVQKLKKVSKIVYLDVPNEVIEDMKKLYFADPKPIIWGNSFSQKEDESEEEALKRSYPELLENRKKEYKKLADEILDYHELRQEGFELEDFLQKLNLSL
jgi:shikimate kinase